MPQDAKTDQEIESCFDVMSGLRPHLGRDEFLATIRHMQAEGYRLAFIRENERVVAVAGYRMLTSLLMGKHLYIDDLVSSQDSRSKGYGEQMIKWLRTRARENGCDYIHLDSGVQRDRAHKFYFTQGFSIAFYHFSEKL